MLWLLDFRWYGICALVAGAAFLYGDISGHSAQSARDEAAAAKAEVVELRKSLNDQQAAALAAAQREQEATKTAEARAQQVADYEQILRASKRSCVASPDDARRVRALSVAPKPAPDGGDAGTPGAPSVKP